MGQEDQLDADLVASFDFEGNVKRVVVQLEDPRWNYHDRVNRLMNVHCISREAADLVVRTVIAEKEHYDGEEVTFVTRSRSGRDAALLFEDGEQF